MVTVIAAQGWTQHNQVELSFVQRRLHGFPSHGLLHRVPSLLKRCRSRSLHFRIAFPIKNLQLSCLRHECKSSLGTRIYAGYSPLTVATAPHSENVTEDQQRLGSDLFL